MISQLLITIVAAMPEHAWTFSVEERFPSKLGAHHKILDSILTELKRLAWNDQDRFAVQMSLEETLTNAIRHGNCQDASKHVEFQCKVSAEKLWARIEDEGCGFDPGVVPDPTTPEFLDVPGGRGLMLIRAYMNEVTYNEAGNCVTLVKIANSPFEDE